MNICFKCGKSWTPQTHEFGLTTCPQCRTYNDQQFKYVQFDPPTPQYGWVCPRCGTVYAPFMASCQCKPPVHLEAGTTSTPNNGHSGHAVAPAEGCAGATGSQATAK